MRLDPGQFTTRIDNRWWPMTPGSRWTYRETDGQGSTQRVQVTVTGQTRTISGVQARVVHDVVTEDGQLVENTYDWYAQDDKGNVWYLGEDTKEYEGGKVVSTEGSWEAAWTVPSRASSCPLVPGGTWPTARSTTRARPRTPPGC